MSSRVGQFSRDQRVRLGCRGTATAVGARNNLEQMAVGVVEIESAPIIPSVDLIALTTAGVGPVRQAAITNSGEDLIELSLAHEKRIVLRDDLTVSLHIVQRRIANLYRREGAEQNRRRKPQNFREEQRRRIFVARGNNRVVEPDRHGLGSFDWNGGR